MFAPSGNILVAYVFSRSHTKWLELEETENVAKSYAAGIRHCRGIWFPQASLAYWETRLNHRSCIQIGHLAFPTALSLNMEIQYVRNNYRQLFRYYRALKQAGLDKVLSQWFRDSTSDLSTVHYRIAFYYLKTSRVTYRRFNVLFILVLIAATVASRESAVYSNSNSYICQNSPLAFLRSHTSITSGGHS